MLKRFKDIWQEDIATCWGKWASLGELMRAWFPFSDWFVLTTEAYQLDHNERKDKVYKAFDQLETKYVAVRSSATKEDSIDDSFAWQFDTFLFVDKQNLIEQIMECHRSIESERIKAYCETKWIDRDDIKVAVVIQKMINSEVAWVVFTINPVTNDTSQMIIEWWFGLGEAVVSGMITPDNYLWSKNKLEILEKNISTQSKKLIVDLNKWGLLEEKVESTIQSIQKLSDVHIQELAMLSLDIEQHYGKPMDIEWAVEDDTLYILQARPVTTIDSPEIQMNKVFSREKWLFYFCMRNESDRIWFKEFLDHDVLHNLFLYDSDSQKTEVWYSKNDLEAIEKMILNRLDEDEISFSTNLLEKLEIYRPKLTPILDDVVEIDSLDTLLDYYNNLILRWSAMTVVFYVPQQESASQERKKLFEYRVMCEKYTEKMYKVFDQYWEKYEKKYTDIKTLISIGEIKEYATTGTLDYDTIKKRQTWLWMLNWFVHTLDVVQEKIKENWLTLIEETYDDWDISWTWIHWGIVTWIVCKITSTNKLHQFKDWCILVSEMTNPDFLPIMKNASAIITDEGWITCHAAIVARELKIPCIVGTKIATQALQNWDLVEVDANNGEIRILKKKKKLFVKEYTRDTSLILQQAWLDRDLLQRIVWVELSDASFPPVIHYMNDWVIDIFSNKSTNQELIRLMKELYTSEPQEFEKILIDYERELKYFNRLWEKWYLSDIEEFKEFVNQLFEWIARFVVMYYWWMIEEIDWNIRKKIKKLRDEDKFFDENDKLIRSSLKKLYPHLGEQVNAMLVSEISSPPSISVLNQRSDHFVMIQSSTYKAISLTSFEKETSWFVFEYDILKDDNLKLLTWSVAQQWLVIWKVRVIKKKSLIWELQEWEILVSTMTTPDFTRAMKLAWAIVTDEGWLLSHAAILSRELWKPCIIWTKIATQALQNWDLVEVDANNGVVRILEKNISIPRKILTSYKDDQRYRQRFDACPHFLFFIGHAHIYTTNSSKYPRGQNIAYAWYSNNTADWYHNLNELEKTANLIIDNITQDETIIDTIVDDYDYAQFSFYEKCLLLKQNDLTNLANNELLEVYKNLENIYSTALIPSGLIDGFALTTDTLIANKIQDHLSSENKDSFTDIFAQLTAPIFHSFLQEEEIALLKIMKENNWILDKNIIQKHQEKYFWIQNNYTDDHVLDLTYFISKREELAKHSIDEKLEEISVLPIDNHNKKQALIASLDIPHDIILLLKMTDKFNEAQDKRKKMTFRATHYFSILLQEIANRTKYTLHQLKYTSPKEIEDILAQKINCELLDQRIKYCMCLLDIDGEEVITDSDLIHELDSLGRWEKSKTNELHWFVACKWKVTGKVSVVESVQDMEKVEEGDVLIAVMTRPDYLPAMKKAAAFVTDEGWITCHAAIVAREMNKPCIIWTKIATSSLQDGDIVEVDADEWAVKLLEAKKKKDNLFFEWLEREYNITRNNEVFHQSMICKWYYYGVTDYFWLENKFVSLCFIEQPMNLSVFVFPPAAKKIWDELKLKIYDSSYIDFLEESYLKHGESLLEISQKLLNDITLENYLDFEKQYWYYGWWLYVSNYIWRTGTPILLKKLEEIWYSHEEAMNLLWFITYPEENTPLLLSQIAIYEIVWDIKSKHLSIAQKNKLIDEWLINYWHIPISFAWNAWGREDVESMIESLLDKNITQEIETINKNHHNMIEKGDQLLKEIDNDEVSVLAYALKKSTTFNEYRKNIFSRVWRNLHALTKELNKNVWLNQWRDLYKLTSDEIWDLIAGNEIDVNEIVNGREFFWFFCNQEGKFWKLTATEVFQVKKYLDEQKSNQKKTNNWSLIKWISANQWKVTWIAKVILWSHEFWKLNEWDILVTTMTSVDFIPIMIKAWAFVTNEWGITSHAAIVAREMNKPCIIWTKIATSSLQDGDIVEVDADEWKVTILSEKSNLSKIFKTQISLSERMEEVPNFDADAFKQEDNSKRIRLGELSEIIDIPYDKPTSFPLEDVINRSEKFTWYMDTHWHETCALRLASKKPGLPKLRMRWLSVKEVVEWWLPEQDIISYEDYRADFVPHFDSNIRSTIFVINQDWVYGEIIAWSHHFLTQWLYTDVKPITFKYDFKQWELSEHNNDALMYMKFILEHLYVPDSVKQQEVSSMIQWEFVQNYLQWYFETVTSSENWLWFIDYNRQLHKTITRPKVILNNNDEFHWQVAYGEWVVKWKVCIVENPTNDVDLSGKILVCDMTTPQYIPLMKKCIAIVTSKWWVLSHAAIVARELWIPCIVGVWNTTNLLKDWMEIELDTNTWSIKILHTNKIIKDRKKNRAWSWSLLSCSYLHDNYNITLFEELWIWLEESLTITRWWVSSCYFTSSTLKFFWEHFAQLAKENPKLIEQWCNDFILKSDLILELIAKKIEQPVTKKSFEEFIAAFNAYGIPHRIIKVMVDYLWSDLLEANLERLEKARLHAEPVYSRTEDYMIYVARTLWQQYWIESHLMLAMTREQFEQLLQEWISTDKDVLQHQYDYGIVHMVGTERTYYFWDNAKQFESMLLTNNSKEIIKGQSAYSWKVYGTVKIILDPNDKKIDFSEWDILVTWMTRPEYLPLIKKCWAFVTDAGWMLSHAAITARELKIPCIVGTQIATSVLKDWDKVEVDAYLGVIKKLAI